MKCPSCGKSLNPRAVRCTGCGTRLIRPSDKLARKMTAGRGLSLACGGLLVWLAVFLFFNDAMLFGTITAVAGAALLFLGKTMNRR
ncbi:zinc-ribbon domain-containing protein [Pseudodesulfovibrio cashew]|uniref:Zinc-ribbon domain-containing protein n=1 Tax=Pseudodesulfovibrio cashew TaxID=2678688 RepID=A0A6I6JFU3_9BACT|nr:zinc-ribbon domain-containing protein [Pseudodesulfovibrio cashew]QGY38887.1 zinc-ribbon domain-containing protein [Pseudodesulfovibrio cashew]